MYKYYILDNGNNNVSGVISDDNGVIKYEALMVKDVFNAFTNSNQKELIKYHESPVREVNADMLSEHFDNVELTKDYWKAFEHAGGGKRKSVAPSSEA